MGYVTPQRSVFIDCISGAHTAMTIDTTAGDITLNTVSTPAYLGKLLQANLIFRATGCRDNSGVANYVGPLAQTIQLRDSSLVYRSAITIQAFSFWCDADTAYNGTIEIQGSYDLSSYIEPSTTYLCKWADADAVGDDLLIYNAQLILRLFLE